MLVNKVLILCFIFFLLPSCQKKEEDKDIINQKPEVETPPDLTKEEPAPLTPDKDKDKDKDKDMLRQSILEKIEKQKPKVNACYRNIIEKKLIPPEGKLTFDLEISNTGELTNLTVPEDQLKSAELVDCISKILKGIKFDESNKIILFKYHYLFSFSEEGAIAV